MIRTIIIIASIFLATGFTGCGYHGRNVWVAPSHENIFRKEFNLTTLIGDYQKTIDIVGLWANQNSFEANIGCYPNFRPRFGDSSVGTMTYCKESTSIHVQLVPSQNATKISLLDQKGAEYITLIDEELKKILTSEFGNAAIHESSHGL